ncbi:unnamed protein product [Symbiodinium sp. CCMP2592]|nr:unnamed protein product [Symbiodinium sp. CCMP2592]
MRSADATATAVIVNGHSEDPSEVPVPASRFEGFESSKGLCDLCHSTPVQGVLSDLAASTSPFFEALFLLSGCGFNRPIEAGKLGEPVSRRPVSLPLVPLIPARIAHCISRRGSVSLGKQGSARVAVKGARARGAEACHVVRANVCATEGAYPGVLKDVAEPVPLLADSPLLVGGLALDLRRSHEDEDDLVGAKRGHSSQGFVCFLRRFLRLAEYLSGLLKRALAKLARKEPEAVTECRVFTEEGPLLIEIWLASSFQSLFSRNQLRFFNFLLSSRAECHPASACVLLPLVRGLLSQLECQECEAVALAGLAACKDLFSLPPFFAEGCLDMRGLDAVVFGAGEVGEVLLGGSEPVRFMPNGVSARPQKLGRPAFVFERRSAVSAVFSSSHVHLSLPAKQGPLKEGSCTVSLLKKRRTRTQGPACSPLLQAPAGIQLVCHSEICPGSGRLRPEQSAVCLIHAMLLLCARAPRAQRRAPVLTKCPLPTSAYSKPSWRVKFCIQAASRPPSEGNEGDESNEPKGDTNCRVLPGASCSLMCRQDDAETWFEPRRSAPSRLQADGILAEAVDLGSFALQAQAVHSCEP